MDEQTQQRQPSDRWIHRRRMTYIALAALIGIAAGAFYFSISPAQASLLEAIAFMLGGVVGTYVGVKIVTEGFGKRHAD